MKKIFLTILAIGMMMQLSAQVVDVACKKAKPLPHTWSVGTCAGRANEGLRTSWVEQLRLVKEQCGFNYLRMHGLFDDDMFVYFEDKKGNAIYNWQYVDEVYDRMLAIGVKPFVELSFFPKGIAADNSKVQMWYQNRITFDESRLPKWKGLVHAFVKHVVERYGIEEVRSWYFEVWNEPNLNFGQKAGFFDGTKTDYFHLYQASAEAIKSVDEQLRVGGPATSNFIPDHRHDGEILDNSKSVFYPQETINKQQWKGVWIEEFLAYCQKHNLPVDFVSCHAYPTDYALDPVTGAGKDAIRYVHSLRDDLRWLKDVVSKSAYPEAEVHITEWSTSPNSRDKMHDLLPPAAYIIKANVENAGQANSIMYWTFTDIFEEKGGGESIFHGGFGMINFQGIVKPSFHAYRMLNQLGDEQLYNQDPLVVTRDSKTGEVAAILYNYPKEFEMEVPSSRNEKNYMQASAKEVSMTLKGLKPHQKLMLETLDQQHGYAYENWVKMGKPHSPNLAQEESLKQAGWSTYKENLQADARGKITIKRKLLPWTCILVVEKNQ